MIRFLGQMARISERANEALATIASTGIFIMMLVTVVDVTGRVGFHRPIKGALEVTLIVFAFVMFLALGYALSKGSHVRVTSLLLKLPLRVRKGLEVLCCVLGVILLAFITWGAGKEFWVSWEQKEVMQGATNLPLWIAKLAFSIGVASFAVQYFVSIFRRSW